MATNIGELFGAFLSIVLLAPIIIIIYFSMH